MIESLFVCNATNTDSKARTKKPGLLPLLNQEKRVLDPKKSQNIAILLRALNVTKEEVCEALLEGKFSQAFALISMFYCINNDIWMVNIRFYLILANADFN